MYYMNKKFLITLLTSNNEKLLKLSYETVINQKNHDLDYDVIIVVNSLNSDYYNNVCEEFSDYDVEIIETESNGKPGKGHNSVMNVFKNHKQYDYLITIDGDDFLYPYALHQLEKSLKEEPDILVLQGNDLLSWNSDSDSSSNIYLNNGFYLIKQHGYALNKWENSRDLVNKNPFKENHFITPIRNILCSRKVLSLDIDKYYCEKCYVLDDYLFYLHFLNIYIKGDLKINVINSNHIYLYNDLNISAVHNIYKLDKDYDYIKSYKSDFIDLNKKFGKKWDNLELPFKYRSGPFKESYFDYNVINGDVQILNYDKYLESENSKYCINFANNIVLKMYNIFKINLDKLLLNRDFEKSLKLCEKLVKNGIYDCELFNYYCVSGYFTNNYDIVIKYINYSKPLCYQHNFLKKFYNI